MNIGDESEKRFVLDSMLGKTAKWLRVLGFDAEYVRLRDAPQIGAYLRKGFLPVTRNRRWCEKEGVLCLSSDDPVEQLREIVSRTPISREEIRLLHRCILCNHLLEPLSREQAAGRVPDYVYETNVRFYRCPRCDKIYWPGSHPKRMRDRLQDMLGWSL